jgi:gamma-glutamylcyclotransferase (GGCT)/AIG2-like uncharacterized protein YtfP
MSEYLFVYGTLLSRFRHPLHRLLGEQAEYLGRGRMTGRLYDLGEYPGLVITPQTESRVWGELYRLRDPRPTLASLDLYEACPPSNTRSGEYRRRQVIARLLPGGSLRSWVYVYQGPVRGRPLIRSGDYLRYLGWAT